MKSGLVLLCITMIVPITGAGVLAQSTIFNVPTTDVVAGKKIYFEFDYIGHLDHPDKGGFHTAVPRLVVGLGGSVEIGLNVATTHSSAPATVYAQPNIKWRFYGSERNGVAASAGAIAYTPLRHRGANDTWGLFYGNVSRKFRGDYGPRLTAGVYGLGGYDFKGADKSGVLLGYEQPLSGRIGFVADWFSGRNGFGYVTPGFSFTLPKNQMINVGYSIGNYGRGNNGLFLYYGVTF